MIEIIASPMITTKGMTSARNIPNEIVHENCFRNGQIEIGVLGFNVRMVGGFVGVHAMSGLLELEFELVNRGG